MPTREQCLAEAAAVIGTWCAVNNIAWEGHPDELNEEPAAGPGGPTRVAV